MIVSVTNNLYLHVYERKKNPKNFLGFLLSILEQVTVITVVVFGVADTSTVVSRFCGSGGGGGSWGVGGGGGH